jgi:hypothetical protein
MNRTTKRAWMAIPLALCLTAAAGCMAHEEMSDTGMEKGMDPAMDRGMSDTGTMDKGMMDKGMLKPGSEGGM